MQISSLGIGENSGITQQSLNNLTGQNDFKLILGSIMTHQPERIETSQVFPSVIKNLVELLISNNEEIEIPNDIDRGLDLNTLIDQLYPEWRQQFRHLSQTVNNQTEIDVQPNDNRDFITISIQLLQAISELHPNELQSIPFNELASFVQLGKQIQHLPEYVDVSAKDEERLQDLDQLFQFFTKELKQLLKTVKYERHQQSAEQLNESKLTHVTFPIFQPDQRNLQSETRLTALHHTDNIAKTSEKTQINDVNVVVEQENQLENNKTGNNQQLGERYVNENRNTNQVPQQATVVNVAEKPEHHQSKINISTIATGSIGNLQQAGVGNDLEAIERLQKTANETPIRMIEAVTQNLHLKDLPIRSMNSQPIAGNQDALGNIAAAILQESGVGQKDDPHRKFQRITENGDNPKQLVMNVQEGNEASVLKRSSLASIFQASVTKKNLENNQSQQNSQQIVDEVIEKPANENVESQKSQPIPFSQSSSVRSDSSVFHLQIPRDAEAQTRSLIREFSNILARANFLQRDGTSKLFIRLFPEELGTLKIDLLQKDGMMTARFIASTSQAKELIDQQIHSLKQAFFQQNIIVDKIEITYSQNDPPKYMGDPGHSGHEQRKEQRQNNQQKTKDENNQFQEMINNVLFESEV